MKYDDLQKAVKSSHPKHYTGTRQTLAALPLTMPNVRRGSENSTNCAIRAGVISFNIQA